MIRIIVAEQGHGRHPPASRHAGGICRLCIKEIIKTIPSERLVRTNRKLKRHQALVILAEWKQKGETLWFTGAHKV